MTPPPLMIVPMCAPLEWGSFSRGCLLIHNWGESFDQGSIVPPKSCTLELSSVGNHDEGPHRARRQSLALLCFNLVLQDSNN